MIEVEKFSCLDGNEARARERYWLENLQVNLNIHVPSRIQQEYKKKYDIEHKEENRIYAKEYREKQKLLKLQDLNNL